MSNYSNPNGEGVYDDGIPEWGTGILGFWLGNHPCKDRYLMRI